MIKVLLFDWDGVLSLLPAFTPIWEKLAPLVERSPDEIKKALFKYDPDYLTGKITNKEFWDGIAKEVRIEPNYELFNKLFYFDILPNQKLLNSLQEVRSQYKIGVVSNNFLEVREKVTKLYGELFDNFSFSCDTGYTKENKGMWEAVLAAYEVEPQEYVFVDDTERNLSIPKEMGMYTIRYVAGVDSLGSLYEKLTKLDVQGFTFERKK